MMSIASDRNSATVRFHRTLYTEQAIGAAATTFADFASFAVRTDGAYFEVAVTDITADVDGDVVAEFCNFVLANCVTGAVSDLG